MFAQSMRSLSRDAFSPSARNLTLIVLIWLLGSAANQLIAQDPDGYASWNSDFAQALEIAGQSRRDVLLDFAGEADSTPSKRLFEQVLRRPEFLANARQDFVLVMLAQAKLDEPSDRIAEPTKSYDEILELYQVRGFPTIVLADRLGRPYAKFVGYHGETVDEFLAKINEAVESRLDRDQLFRKAESSQGIERARAMHSALETLQENWRVRHYRREVEEIVANDAGNIAGLRLPYELELIRFDAEVDTIRQSVERLDQLVESFDPRPEVLQEILFTKASLLFEVDQLCSREVFMQAREVDVNSALARKIDQVLATTFEDLLVDPN